MVVGETANQVVGELLLDTGSEINQELVTLVKSVCTIVEFHPHDVEEYENRRSPRVPDVLHVVFAAVGMFTYSQEHGISPAPGNLRHTHNQVFAGTRIADDRLSPFDSIVNRHPIAFFGRKEIFFDLDSRIKRPHRFPHLFHRGAYHVDFMRIRVEDHKRVHLVRIQELNDALFEIASRASVGLQCSGHVIINDNGAFRTIFEIAVVPYGMNRTVIIVAIKLLTVNDIVTSVLDFRKILGLGRHVNDIFLVDVPVHVFIEKAHQILAGLSRGLPTDKPVRDKYSPSLAVHMPVDRKRDPGLLQFQPQNLR